MEELQIQKPDHQIDQQELLIQQQRHTKTKINYSQNLSSYLNLIGLQNIEQFNHHRQKLFKEMRSLGFRSDINADQKLQFNIIGATKNYQCFQINVRYNKFFFQVLLLNVKEQSPNHKIEKCHKGNFSSVYHTLYENKNIGIKCTKFKNKTFLKVLRDTLLQYLTFDMVRMFRAGPQLPNVFWFDLIVYNDCIEFTMQFCSDKLKQQTLANDLKQSLFKMHSLKIIHFDIKPQNICYSQSFNRNVFIDFGLQKVINQELGQKSQANFRGSLLFCSKQMKQCYTKGQSMIDLYFNDAICLEGSLKQIQKQKYQGVFTQLPKKYNQTQIFILIKIKYLLWKINQFDLNTLWLKQNLIQKISVLKSEQLAQIKNFISYLNYHGSLQIIMRKLNNQIQDMQISQGLLIQTKFNNTFKEKHQDDPQQIKEATFKLRMNAIKTLNQSSIQSGKALVNNNVKEYIHFLSDPTNIEKWEISLYYRIFTEIIQINSWKATIAQKHLVCNTFNTVILRNESFQTLTIQEKVRCCFMKIGQFINSQYFLSRCVGQIIKNSLLSIILLQIFPQKELSFFILKLITMQSNVQRQIRLFIHILSCLEWILFKRDSIYFYEYLRDVVFQMIRMKVAQFPIRNPQFQLYYLIIKASSYFQRHYLKIDIINRILSHIRLEEYYFKIDNYYSSISQYQQFIAELYVFLTYYLEVNNFVTRQFQKLLILQKYKEEQQICAFSYYQFIIYSTLSKDLQKYKGKISQIFSHLTSDFACFNNIFVSIFINHKQQYYYQDQQKYYFQTINYCQFVNTTNLQTYLYGLYSYIQLVVDKLKKDTNKFDEQSLHANIKFKQIHQFFVYLVDITKNSLFHSHGFIKKLIIDLSNLTSSYIFLLKQLDRPVNMALLKGQLDKYVINLECCQCKLLFQSYFCIMLYAYYEEGSPAEILNLIMWIVRSGLLTIQAALYLLQNLSFRDNTFNYHKLYAIYVLELQQRPLIYSQKQRNFYAQIVNNLWKERFIQQNGQSLYFKLINHLCLYVTKSKFDAIKYSTNVVLTIKIFTLLYINAKSQTYDDFVDFNIDYFKNNKQLLREQNYCSLYFAIIFLNQQSNKKKPPQMSYSYYLYIWSNLHTFYLKIRQLINAYAYKSFLLNQIAYKSPSIKQISKIQLLIQKMQKTPLLFPVFGKERYDKSVKKKLLKFKRKSGEKNDKYYLINKHACWYYGIK